MGFGHSDPSLVTFDGEKGRGSGTMVHISLHMRWSPIVSLYLLSWTLLPLFSFQSAPETSPGWEMSRSGEEQVGNPEGIYMGWDEEAGRGSWGRWGASCRDGDLLRSGEPIYLWGSPTLRPSSLLSSQSWEHLCRSRGPNGRTSASHARPRRIQMAARLRYTEM